MTGDIYIKEGIQLMLDLSYCKRLENNSYRYSVVLDTSAHNIHASYRCEFAVLDINTLVIPNSHVQITYRW